MVNLEYERGKMNALCDQEPQQISRLKEVLKIVKQYVLSIYMCLVILYCLQCFDAVGWAAGRASGL